jgi:hypothetical protein
MRSATRGERAIAFNDGTASTGVCVCVHNVSHTTHLRGLCRCRRVTICLPSCCSACGDTHDHTQQTRTCTHTSCAATSSRRSCSRTCSYMHNINTHTRHTHTRHTYSRAMRVQSPWCAQHWNRISITRANTTGSGGGGSGDADTASLERGLSVTYSTCHRTTPTAIVPAAVVHHVVLHHAHVCTHITRHRNTLIRVWSHLSVCSCRCCRLNSTRAARFSCTAVSRAMRSARATASCASSSASSAAIGHINRRTKLARLQHANALTACTTRRFVHAHALEQLGVAFGSETTVRVCTRQ